MKMIKIPRNETEPVKQILKKLKPFTYYVNSYDIIFSLHNTILKFEASGSIYEINLKLDNEIITAVIKALAEANKKIYYKIQ